MFDEVEFFLRYGFQKDEPWTAALINTETDPFGLNLPLRLFPLLRADPDATRRLFEDPRCPRDG